MKVLDLSLSVIKEPMTLKKYLACNLVVVVIFLLMFLSWKYIAPMFIKIDVKSITICTQRVFGVCLEYENGRQNHITNPALSIISPVIWINVLFYLFISIKRLLNVKSVYPENFRWGFIFYAVILGVFCILCFFIYKNNIEIVNILCLFIVYSSPVFIAFSIRDIISEKHSETKTWWGRIFSKINVFQKVILSIHNSNRIKFFRKNILYIGLIYFTLTISTLPLLESNSIAISMAILPSVIAMLIFLGGTINLVRMLYFLK